MDTGFASGRASEKAPYLKNKSAVRVPTKTDWKLVVVLVVAGIVGAFQVGKAAIAIPLLRQDLGLELVSAAWVVGAYAALGALAGLTAGIGVSLAGARNAAVAGLLAVALGSALGAFASHLTPLLVTRVIEGCGFLAITIAIPTLIRSVTAPPDRALAMVFWAAYMPAGMAIMMFVGPLLAPYGWPLLWQVNAALAAIYAAVIWLLIPLDADDHAVADRSLLNNVGRVLTSPGPMLLAAAFALYTFQYGAMTGLMPTLLVERAGLTIAQAGSLSALTVVANTLGNLSTGIFVRLKIPTWAVMASAFGFLGVASFGIFSDALPVMAVVGLASASLAITGLVPASIFAASPRAAGQAALLALTLGLIAQASNIGQLLGPAALGSVVHHFGWDRAPMVFGVVAVAGIAVALGLRRILQPNAGSLI
ncbi:MAG: hypothetical protein JWN71_3155 [Xanthobacteraceae bacterium]|nr:hypothetical protein [Xanthobacteraceae bacterium]